MSEDVSVIVSTDLGEYFREEVSMARDSLGVEFCEHTEYYLVNLLCDYLKPNEETLFPGNEPLALLYKRALEADALDRIQLLKNLGDVSLYAAGFFSDFIARSAVDLDYYITMGGSAYSNLSNLVGAQRGRQVSAEIYSGLAEHFGALVEVLIEIDMRGRNQTDDDAELVRLYERWMRTGSERLHRMLLEKGLIHTAQKKHETLQ